MVVTQDSSCVRQVEAGQFPPQETFERRSFPGDPANVYFSIKGAVKFSEFGEAGKKLPWRCCEK